MRIVRDQKGVIVGNYSMGTYYTNRKPEHFMKKYQGFGVSWYVLQQVFLMGCERVQITYEGKKGVKVYSCPIHTFMKSNKTHTFMQTDKQHFVSISDMEELK